MKNVFLFVVQFFCLSVIGFGQTTETLPPSYRENQSNQLDIYRAEAERINNLIHTKLDLKFSFEKEEVYGEAWLTLKPHFYETKELTLDTKAMLIHEVELVQGNSKKKLNFTNDDFKLYIHLDKTYNRNQEYTVYIKYTARPNEVKEPGGSAISAAKGVYFINPRGEETDKPTQIWTQGEPSSNSVWFPTIDEFNQKTSQELYLTVPDKYVTLSNGELKKQTNNPDGTRTDYWNFSQKHAPYLFFFGVGDFAIVKDSWKGKEVSYYVEHEYEPYARQIFGDTPEMIQFFSDLLNYEYPWNKYSQIVGRDYISGAMENTTAVMHLERAQQKPGQLIDGNIWEGTIAHELFHHWFGDLVTMESPANITVNESFANYSEYLWFEHKYGKDKAEEDRYDDLNSYFEDPSNFFKNLVRYHYRTKDDIFDRVSYEKGGKGVLHMLRNYLGDDAFFAGLNKYLKTYEYGTAEADQLRLVLESVSGRDLHWFFDQWYFSNGHPKMNVAYDYDATSRKVKVTVVQTQSNYFEFPFAIDVIIDGKAKRHFVWVAKKKENVYELDADKSPQVVVPNADQVTLCEINDTKSTEAFAAQYKYGTDNVITRILALKKLSDAQSTSETALNILIDGLNDSYEGIRRKTIQFLDAQDAKVKSKAMPFLIKLADSDPKTAVRAAALNKLNQMGLNDVSIFEKGLKSESYNVQSAAVTGIIKNQPQRAEEFSNLPNEVLESSPELIGELLQSWMAENDQSKLKVAADAVAFYFFTQFENPTLGAKLEKGFNWVLSNDDIGSTKKIADTYTQVYRYYAKDNPQLGVVLKNMIDKAIELKVKANRENPSSTYEMQINLLMNTKELMK